MNLKHNPWSADDNEHQDLLKNKALEAEAREQWGRLETRKKAETSGIHNEAEMQHNKERTRYNIADLHKQTEWLKQINPHPPTGTSPLQEEEVAHNQGDKEGYMIPWESELAQKFKNPVIKWCMGLGEDCIAVWKATASVAKWMAYAPVHLLQLWKWDVTYDWFDHV